MGVTVQPRTGRKIDVKELGLIPRRYRQTTAGVIPEDWNVDRIGDIASIKTGAKNTQDKQADGEYPFFVRSQEIERINSYSYDGEAVLTAGDGVGTGKVFHYISGRFDIHQRVYRIADFCDAVDGRYFFYQFSTRFYNRIMSMTAKSSVDSVRLEMISDMRIPMPTPREQRAIAQALSDVDELLVALDTLIAKKLDIKRGAAQQLLSGIPRLPGFDYPWNIARIGDLLDYERPDRYIVRSVEYSEHGKVPVLTANKAFVLGFTDETFGVCRDVPAIVFDDFTTDCKFTQVPFKVKSSAIKILRPKNDRVSLKYMFERMQLLRFSSETHKRYYIAEYQETRISMPDYDEQLAIVSAISDMDVEIAALEQRRDKTLAIKQGMMQELLTGLTRLI